jgi:hypothetical protein
MRARHERSQTTADVLVQGAGQNVGPDSNEVIDSGQLLALRVGEGAAVLEGSLPRYRSHKEVGALLIGDVHGNLLFPAKHSFDASEVSDEYLTKHKPHGGGYYVRHHDGYESFSPAAAFEKGYTPI